MRCSETLHRQALSSEVCLSRPHSHPHPGCLLKFYCGPRGDIKASRSAVKVPLPRAGHAVEPGELQLLLALFVSAAKEL